MCVVGVGGHYADGLVYCKHKMNNSAVEINIFLAVHAGGGESLPS